MAVVNPAGWLQNAGATHTAAQMRTYVGSLLGGVISIGATTRTRGGVHPGLGGQLAVTANGTPNMSVNVAAGLVYIPGSQDAAQGVYFCENDASVNLAIAAAPGAGVSRIDLVVARVLDTFYGDASSAWQLAVVTGTAAASPGVPTTPANCVTLAQVLVGSSVSSITQGNITDVRPFAAALGGIIPMTSTNMVATSQVADGTPGYMTDLDIPIIFNGTNWVPLNSIVQTVNYNAAATSQAVTSTSYVNVTNASLGFQKRFSTTRLFVSLGISGFPTNAGTGVAVQAGVSIAGTDYDLTSIYYNDNLASHATLPFASRYINNITVGSKTAQVRVKVTANSWSFNSDDRITLTVQECI